MPRFSANLGFLWAELPLLDRIDRAAAAGFLAVELHWPYDTPANQVRDACAMHGLTLLGLNTPVGHSVGDFGLAALPGREHEFRESAEMAFEYANTCGARMIHVMAGIVPVEKQMEAGAVLVSNLVGLASKANHQDLTLLLEPINQVDKPGYFYSRPDQVCEIINAVGSGNVKLLFDTYHAAHSEPDVGASLAANYGLVGHVQIAGFPDRAEPDQGPVDCEAIMHWLDAQGYDGWVGAEYVPRGSVESGLDWKTRWDQASSRDRK